MAVAIRNSLGVARATGNAPQLARFFQAAVVAGEFVVIGAGGRAASGTAAGVQFVNDTAGTFPNTNAYTLLHTATALPPDGSDPRQCSLGIALSRLAVPVTTGNEFAVDFDSNNVFGRAIAAASFTGIPSPFEPYAANAASGIFPFGIGTWAVSSSAPVKAGDIVFCSLVVDNGGGGTGLSVPTPPGWVPIGTTANDPPYGLFYKIPTTDGVVSMSVAANLANAWAADIVAVRLTGSRIGGGMAAMV